MASETLAVLPPLLLLVFQGWFIAGMLLRQHRRLNCGQRMGIGGQGVPFQRLFQLARQRL
jgi:hypothetical protein